ncbi:uncharacterized protein ISCGN_019521 [Ixodes scapularis]
MAVPSTHIRFLLLMHVVCRGAASLLQRNVSKDTEHPPPLATPVFAFNSDLLDDTTLATCPAPVSGQCPIPAYEPWEDSFGVFSLQKAEIDSLGLGRGTGTVMAVPSTHIRFLLLMQVVCRGASSLLQRNVSKDTEHPPPSATPVFAFNSDLPDDTALATCPAPVSGQCPIPAYEPWEDSFGVFSLQKAEIDSLGLGRGTGTVMAVPSTHIRFLLLMQVVCRGASSLLQRNVSKDTEHPPPSATPVFAFNSDLLDDTALATCPAPVSGQCPIPAYEPWEDSFGVFSLQKAEIDSLGLGRGTGTVMAVPSTHIRFLLLMQVVCRGASSLLQRNVSKDTEHPPPSATPVFAFNSDLLDDTALATCPAPVSGQCPIPAYEPWEDSFGVFSLQKAEIDSLGLGRGTGTVMAVPSTHIRFLLLMQVVCRGASSLLQRNVSKDTEHPPPSATPVFAFNSDLPDDTALATCPAPVSGQCPIPAYEPWEDSFGVFSLQKAEIDSLGLGRGTGTVMAVPSTHIRFLLLMQVVCRGASSLLQRNVSKDTEHPPPSATPVFAFNSDLPDDTALATCPAPVSGQCPIPAYEPWEDSFGVFSLQKAEIDSLGLGRGTGTVMAVPSTHIRFLLLMQVVCRGASSLLQRNVSKDTEHPPPSATPVFAFNSDLLDDTALATCPAPVSGQCPIPAYEPWEDSFGVFSLQKAEIDSLGLGRGTGTVMAVPSTHIRFLLLMQVVCRGASSLLQRNVSKDTEHPPPSATPVFAFNSDLPDDTTLATCPAPVSGQCPIPAYEPWEDSFGVFSLQKAEIDSLGLGRGTGTVMAVPSMHIRFLLLMQVVCRGASSLLQRNVSKDTEHPPPSATPVFAVSSDLLDDTALATCSAPVSGQCPIPAYEPWEDSFGVFSLQKAEINRQSRLGAWNRHSHGGALHAYSFSAAHAGPFVLGNYEYGTYFSGDDSAPVPIPSPTPELDVTTLFIWQPGTLPCGCLQKGLSSTSQLGHATVEQTTTQTLLFIQLLLGLVRTSSAEAGPFVLGNYEYGTYFPGDDSAPVPIPSPTL